MLQLWVMWFIYAFERCYHFLLLLKTALESQHSILLGKKKKLSLIHKQESSRLLKLQWMWIKLGWIMTFKVKQKDLQFICHCWALNEQLNCSYLEHSAFQNQLFGIETIPRLELCASKIFSNYSCTKNGFKPQLFRRGKGSWLPSSIFNPVVNRTKETQLEFTWVLGTLQKTSSQLWTLYDFSYYFLHIIL